MSKLLRHAPVALVLILASLSSSCWIVSRNRPILRNRKALPPTQKLLVATRDQLNDRIARLYGAINSFQATVDMTPSVGSVYKGQITEYKDVRAYVLFRKPSDIRIIGLAPVIRTNIFDMVSDGLNFRFFLNQSNLFVQGANDAPATSKNAIENLRPDAFLSSMLVRPVNPETETLALEDATDEDNALYILHFIGKRPDGSVRIARNVWFDRLDLSIVRQKVLDDMGFLVSDTRYAKWQPYNNVSFASHIDINRPQDGYGVVMDMVQVQMNKSLTDEQFVLKQPDGAKIQTIGSPAK